MILLAAQEAYKESQAFTRPAAKFIASEAGKTGRKATGIVGVRAAGKAGAESAGKASAKAAGKAGAGAADDVLQAGIKAGGKLAGGVIIGISLDTGDYRSWLHYQRSRGKERIRRRQRIEAESGDS